MKKWTAIPFLLSLLAATPAGAQLYFGQNQVQYETFDWQVWETEHFYVHYYPEMRQAALDAAQMAERAYTRLSRVMRHQFREKKPLILFSSRGHFGQNHVTGDLGEGTGGVTEAIRHRVLLPFTGDFHSFERVLTHELVHSFQYDIFARGRAGGGLTLLQAANPPLWFVEGMAEYLALGPDHPLTDAWMRDAAIHGRLPSMQQLKNPNEFFPYRYGESIFQYVGGKWGDESIGRIMQAVPGAGLEKAIEREIGISVDELGEEWQDAMQVKYLPDLPNRTRPRTIGQELLSTRKSGGASDIFLAPSLSHDGSQIAFLSRGSVARGEVFIDLWLGDAKTGKRISRLVKSILDPNYEELRLLYSQSSFSPDGKFLAFTAQSEGRDVLYLLDVKKRKRVKRFDIPNIDVVMSPAFSPDGGRIVFSGTVGGTSDLYAVNIDGTGLDRLTNDPVGDLQPQWAPDGKRIAFATERAAGTDYNELRFDKWAIGILDLDTKKIEILPGQAGLNLNPMWSPDARTLAFISDRGGTANVFLYDFEAKEHYQLTNVVGAVSAITEFSPALTWSRGADVMAFTYFDDGEYTVWSVDDPRRLKAAPYRAQQIVAQATGDGDAGIPPVETSSVDSMTSSLYRSSRNIRPSALLPGTGREARPVSMAALADSALFGLPDTSRFTTYRYRGVLQPEYISRPSIGYQPDNFGQGVYGQSILVLTDMLGNQQLALAGGLNGRLSELQFFSAYQNLSRRFQYTAGLMQEPYFYSSGGGLRDLGGGYAVQEERLSRHIIRSAFSIAQYPINRFKRFELGLTYNHVDRATMVLSRDVLLEAGVAGSWYIDRVENQPGVAFLQPSAAYVVDNTIFGYTGPIMGTRARFQIQPALGGLRWMSYTADFRRYEPVIFNFLTIATRFQARVAVGRDEETIPAYIGNPSYIRGYNRESFSESCQFTDISDPNCSASRLIGSRIAMANAELRFPLVRAFALGILPIALPPIDGVAFYDVGMAWSTGDQTNFFSTVSPEARSSTRYPLRSYGYGVRLNLYNLALLRWDYSIPLDLSRRKGFWTFSIGPSF